ncbi:hypothetical protein B0H12DRAFT_1135997 [Mycena haematopus]|nr:hypothetical protein B0H12DRAFT_1135997 [Mycena haematopus]
MTSMLGVEELIDNLTVSSVISSPVAPQLSSISFWTICVDLDFRAYVEMVKSRWNSPNCAVNRVMLSTNFASDLDELEDLELLRQEGLDICSYSPGDLLASWEYSHMQPFSL